MSHRRCRVYRSPGFSDFSEESTPLARKYADAEMTQSDRPSSASGSRLRGGEATRLHVTLAVGLVLCVAAFWFELGRALGGNALSWAYVFEWPLLAVFAVYMWWQLLHPGREKSRTSKNKTLDPSFQVMLERWEESKEELDRSRGHDGESPGP